MTDDQIIEIVENEFREKFLGVTQQYLDIHNPIYIDGKLKVDRIDRERSNGIVSVFVPVENEKFHFVAWVDTTDPTLEIINTINTEPLNRVYFRATSEELSKEQLKTLTKLTPTESWDKGDKRKFRESTYEYSSLSFLPNPEPDEFEDKIRKLLDYLETDREGIKSLVDNANCWIQVAMDFHVGNGMIGGPSINKEIIKRMSDLGLSIDFDVFVGGNKLRD